MLHFLRDSHFLGPDFQGKNKSSENQSQNIFPLPKWEDIISVDIQGGASGQGENVEKMETLLILQPLTMNPNRLLWRSQISFKVKNQQLLYLQIALFKFTLGRTSRR